MSSQVLSQQLFKPLTNRTRTKPKDLFQKFTRQINVIQHEVCDYNKRQRQTPSWILKESNEFGYSHTLHLKTMTEPKFQKLLLSDELNVENSIEKLSKKNVKKSNFFKSGKQFKNSSLNASMKSSQNINFFQSKAKSVKKIQKKISTNSQPINPEITSFKRSDFSNKNNTLITNIQHSIESKKGNFKNQRKNTDNIFDFTESIILPMKEIKEERSLKNSIINQTVTLSLRDQIIKKQHLLNRQWQKTQNYKESIKINENSLEEVERRSSKYNKLYKVLDKIKGNRVQTTSSALSQRINIEDQLAKSTYENNNFFRKEKTTCTDIDEEK